MGGGAITIDLTTTFGSGHYDLIHGSTGAILIPPPGTSAVVTTPTLFLLTNTPQTLNITLDLLAEAPFAGFANLDYGHTVSFSNSGPAFNVPQGLTVEAPGLDVFNNHWVDPRAAAAVPEPGTFSLLGGVLLALTVRLRFRGSRAELGSPAASGACQSVTGP